MLNVPVLRCGWPWQLPESSTIVYCSLPLGHDGPVCALLNSAGDLVASAPRFPEGRARRAHDGPQL